jgi:hypothetical protein
MEIELFTLTKFEDQPGLLGPVTLPGIEMTDQQQDEMERMANDIEDG